MSTREAWRNLTHYRQPQVSRMHWARVKRKLSKDGDSSYKLVNEILLSSYNSEVREDQA